MAFDEEFIKAVDYAFGKCNLQFSAEEGQMKAIFAAVTGNDVFVIAAAGFGKSICFRHVCNNFNIVVADRMGNESASSHG